MLFKDSSKLKEYADITASVNFVSFKQTIAFVEEQYLVPLLGNELYAALNADYTQASNEESLTTAQQYLLDQCRRVVGPYVCVHHAPKNEVKFTDSGLRREETANSKTAFQYQVTNFQEANRREGELQSETLLLFLDENKESYPEWVESKAFDKYKGLFIKTAKEFGEYFPSQSPYRNFYAMRTKMFDVEQLNIRRAIGATLFDSLKARDKDPDGVLTEKEKTLLDKLKRAIANFTASFSLPFLSVRVDENGITVTGRGTTVSRDQDGKNENAPAAQISLLIKAAADTGSSWLDDAIQYLTDNSVDFSNWTDPAKVTTSKRDCTNRELNGTFGLM